jgi:hypothetical protein
MTRGSAFHFPLIVFGASTNGKSGDFGSPMWRFESSRPSQFEQAKNNTIKEER